MPDSPLATSGGPSAAAAAPSVPRSALLVPVVLAGYLMIIIDTSVVVTALPQIQQTLSLSAARTCP
jgi:hypothetical protein